MKIPMPGDRLFGRTVIASVYYTDEMATLLMLLPQSPYFEVSQLDLEPNGNLHIRSSHHNIVHAVREYEQMGGDV